MTTTLFVLYGILGMVFLVMGIIARNSGAGGDVKEATYYVALAAAMFALMAAIGSGAP